MTAFSFGNFFPSLRWTDVVTGLIPKLNATFRELDAFFGDVLAHHESARRNEDEDHNASQKRKTSLILSTNFNKMISLTSSSHKLTSKL
ncbi:hypothetical protein K1719_020142 [Acacia pycnantha]|nr:hypothetical protein K1719_020142 [Acacia pycnantha]